MGRIKDWAIEQDSQGFSSKETRVCIRCIEDSALIAFVKKAGVLGYRCSYCKERKSDATVKTVPFDDFVRRILEGFESEWSDPNEEGVAWDEGWVGTVLDSYDLLHQEVDIGFTSDALLDDVQDSISDRQWCQREFYELKEYQALMSGWKEFSNVVKYESRYVFMRRPDPRAEGRGREEIAPTDFLDALGSVINKCNLITTLKKGTKLFRVRTHTAGAAYKLPSELGPPPAQYAVFPNRMSAAGISAFYAAFDYTTAVAETKYADRKALFASLAEFSVSRDIYVVDLSKLPEIPSIFEPNSHLRRHGLIFLRQFLQDFTAPVTRDGREHIEYVPTQVVAEYLRFVHTNQDKRRVSGIIYKSARTDDSNACVLFFGPEGVCEKVGRGELGFVSLSSVSEIAL